MESPVLLLNHTKSHRDTITSLAFSPSGEQVAAASLDKSVTICNLRNSQDDRCIKFDIHEDEIYGMDWSPKGDLLASVGKDRAVAVWQPTVHNGSAENFRAHTSAIRSVHFNSTGRRVSRKYNNEKTLITFIFLLSDHYSF